MNEKVLHIVEFNKIIDQLTENANSAPAKILCRNLKPMDNLPDIRLAQEETDAALQLLFRKGNVNFGSNRDFGYTFGALSIGSTSLFLFGQCRARAGLRHDIRRRKGDLRSERR